MTRLAGSGPLASTPISITRTSCFPKAEPRAIDFDDCGWSAYVYDLAVPLSELEGRWNCEALREALLDGYARQRALPNGYNDHLDALTILRRVQLIIWILESQKQAAFRNSWQGGRVAHVLLLCGPAGGVWSPACRLR